MGIKRKPSVKQISELTGFSAATVSNALNMKKGVNKETSERIFRVAEKIGYRGAAKELKHIKFVLFRKTGAIVDGSMFHPFVIEGVEQEAKENGMPTMFVQLNYSDIDYEEQLGRIINDTEGGVILLATEMMEEDFLPFGACRSPLILLDGWSSRSPFSGVLIDNRDSARTAVNYLIGQGHRDIGYVCGSYRIQAFLSREWGYRQAMYEHGLSVRPEWIVTVGTQTDDACADMLQWLKNHSKLPTAFFIDDDRIAYGVMQAFTKHGIHIPDDVSIVGFDDLSYSAVSTPALTTVHVHKQEMGRTAVRYLLMMAKHMDEHVKVQSCTVFIERESVRKLAR